MCNIPFGRLSVLFNFYYLFEDLDVFWSFHTLPHSFQTPTQFCVLFFVWHPSGVVPILLCVWPFTGVRSNCREPPPSRKLPPPLLPEAIIASGSLTKGGTSHLPPCCMLAFCLVWGCARLVHTVTTVMSSYTQLPCPVWEKHEVTERSNKKTVFPGSFWSNWSRCSVSSALHTAIEEHRSSELSSSCSAQTHFNFLIKEFSHFADKTTEGIRDSAIRHLTVTGPSPVLTAPEVRTFQSFFLFGAL